MEQNPCRNCVHFHTEESENPNIQYSSRPMCRRYGDIGKVPHPTTKDCLEARAEEKTDEMPTEASPLTPPARRPVLTARRACRSKLQPGGYEGAFEGKRVLLTPKQVEFLERLSEQEDWEPDGENGEYFADAYAECLSDTMSPMAVGAMVTTLREKGILASERVRDHGKSICKFRLTDAGKSVYGRLIKGEV